MTSIPVEYRADLDQRRGQITFNVQNAKKVTLDPGVNQVSLTDLQQLENIPYFQKGVENKIFIYTKPEIKQTEIPEPKQPETVKDSVKTTKLKATSLSSLTVDDEV